MINERIVYSLKMLIVIMLLISWNKIYSQVNTETHEGASHGVVNFKINCSPATQTKFNEAMTLLHHMTYPQAREMFQKIIESDSVCPMAYWGFAMTLFQPLWPTRPNQEQLKQGFNAIQKSKSLSPSAKREQLLINAADAFFHDPDSADYWKRIRSWKEVMEIAYSAFPEDHEIDAFYSLALLATVPPDQITSTNNTQAAEILLKILKENPNHPGAMHYLIHANDTPGRERESMEILQKYKEVAPNNPHALHMPTHIYTRVGDWQEVIDGNLNAALAALQFPAGDKSQYTWDEFPHAIEYLIYAYLQTGNDAEASAQLKRLNETQNLEPSFKTAFHIASTKARYVLERKAWKEAASIDPLQPAEIDWKRFPWPEAISWFARGVGSIHLDNSSEAKKSLQHMEELENTTAAKKEILFARNIKVLQLELTAFILNKEGQKDSAITLLTEAAELESSTPKHAVTPAPTMPAYELLGDQLYEYGMYREALTAYKQSLEKNPNRFNSLIGAARTSAALNDKPFALYYYHQLIKLTDNKSERNELKEAHTFSSE